MCIDYMHGVRAWGSRGERKGVLAGQKGVLRARGVTTESGATKIDTRHTSLPCGNRHEVVLQRESMQRAEARKRMAEIPNTGEVASLPCGPVGCTPFRGAAQSQPPSFVQCIFEISGPILRRYLFC